MSENPNSESIVAQTAGLLSPTAQSAEAMQASGLRYSRPGGLRYWDAIRASDFRKRLLHY